MHGSCYANENKGNIVVDRFYGNAKMDSVREKLREARQGEAGSISG